ncbi:hypothetical protein ACLOJK_027371 [Asimina triloba]
MAAATWSMANNGQQWPVHKGSILHPIFSNLKGSNTIVTYSNGMRILVAISEQQIDGFDHVNGPPEI